MTLIRVISQTSRIFRPSLVNFETCVCNKLCRNASILSVNMWQSENFPINNYLKPKIAFSLEGQFVRNKFKKSKHTDDDEEDYDNEMNVEEDFVADKHSKTTRITVNSLRLDLIIKSGLNIARNKVETLFYESKIRVNGKKVEKKGGRVDVGDEIDVIKGTSQMNPDHLVVQRIEILGVKPKDDEDGLYVQLRRNKSLIIENYEDPYKGKNDDLA